MDNYKITRQDESIIVSISGRLDTPRASKLDLDTQNLLTAEIKAVTFEIGELNYISSSGIRCFVRIYKEAKANGSEFKVKNMQPSIREIFDATGLSKILGV